jgi:integrase
VSESGAIDRVGSEDAAKARGPLALGDLADRLVHDLRRTAVRNLERAGVPGSVAMRLTGHKTEAVYRRYAIIAESDLEEGVAKFAKLHGERATE